MLKKFLVAFLVSFGTIGQSHGSLIISQYYEGPSVNKWIELFNMSDTSLDLSTFSVGHWNNANAEGYKTNVAPNFFVALTGSLASGSTFVLGNTANTTPGAPVVANLNNNSVINFNGNDSIGVFTTGTFSTASLIDVIGFTTANEGVDKSFVRTSTAPGWDTTAGSNVTTFVPGIWTQVDLATVNSATAGTDNFIGFSSLPVTAVPEPTSMALIGMVGVAGMAVRYRRKNASSSVAV